ncbi:hypothetical protein Tco_0255792 [Tanacetum coccineum]
MCMYLKNQGGYKQSHFKGMNYEDIRPERIWDQNQSFVPKDSKIEKEVMKRSRFDFQKPLAKRQKVGEVSGSVKYPIIDWEVFIEESRSYWRIIRVGNHIEDLVKKKLSSTKPTIDKENVLWVKLKRLFEPDDDDTLWKLQRYTHDPLKWKLYDTHGVHHVSTERGHDIFMLVEKDYPLTRALMTIDNAVLTDNAAKDDDMKCRPINCCNMRWKDGWTDCGQVGGQGNEVNDGVDGFPDFSTIIVQQLQNLLPTIVAQLGNHGNNLGNNRNQNGNAVNDNIQEYDGKGGAIVYTCWIEKMDSVQNMSRCRDNQKVKYIAGWYIQRISLTGFPAQSVGSSNTDVLDLPCLLVLITGTSQSRQHVNTSLIHIESHKSPTAVLFDDDTGRISIRHCEY